MDILLPILESSVVLAGHYTKMSGRTVMTKTDLEYGLKYMSSNHVGDHIGSLFPEIYDDSSSDESVDEVSDEDTPEFTRYSGDDEWCLKMNKAVDEWDSWIPAGPAERMLKAAIEKKI